MKVIKAFRDALDNRYEYRVGDEYPRPGHKPTAERIKELSGSDNRMGVPLIEGVQEEPKAEPKAEKKPLKRGKK